MDVFHSNETHSFERLHVLLIGTVALVRLAVKQLLSNLEGILIVGEASTGPEAVAMAGRMAPDIALIAIHRFDGTWVAYIREILAASPKTRPIILSNDDDGAGLFRAAGAGVWGYLPQDISQEELIRAVRMVARGHVVIDCALSPDQFVRLGPLNSRNSDALLPFSKREFTVIKAMANGYTDSQIARELGLSVPTVKTHVRSILRKTRSRNRAAAIATAFRHGVIT